MNYRRLTDEYLVIATHNPGKLHEIRDLVKPFGITVQGAAELGLPEPKETGTSFSINAQIKARAAACATNIVALADDSGLEVCALNGAPGVYSARWAGIEKDFSTAMKRVEEALDGVNDRRARFIAALALCWPDGHSEIFIGEVWGNLVFPPQGELGFGYDPIFMPDGQNLTFGEMNPAMKHAISHRSRAFQRLTSACFSASNL